jgi:hypothetical protein
MELPARSLAHMANTRTLVTGETIISVETQTHTIEVYEGCLFIGENTFPDNCVSLSPEITQVVLNALLAAQGRPEPMRDVES